MTDDTGRKQIQIEFQFKDIYIPTYVNATIVNVSPEGNLLLDFGFFDTVGKRELIESGTTLPVEPVSRLVIGKPVAQQLVRQLMQALNVIETDDIETDEDEQD